MMDVIAATQRALIIAPHPDDEVLGCGGTIARLASAGADVHVAIATRGASPRFDEQMVRGVQDEARQAHAQLGVARTHFLSLPAAELDMIPHANINSALGALVADVAPDALFLPFIGDIHLDHQLIFLSGMVASRPNRSGYPPLVLAYETLSETNWHAPYVTPGFTPNLFVDIGATLDRKLDAMRSYASQLREFPDERSIEAITALATLRGATVRRRAAEAFVLLRHII